MTSIKKWGNSLAVRIPAHLAQQLHWLENTPVTYAVVDGSLVISPVPVRASSSLQLLLDQVTAENIHGETDAGTAVGQESW